MWDRPISKEWDYELLGSLNGRLILGILMAYVRWNLHAGKGNKLSLLALDF